MEMWNGTTILENCLTISYEMKHTYTLWTSNSTLGIYQKEIKTSCSHKACRRTFITTLCVIAQSGIRAKCSSIEEWIKKIAYSHNGKLLVNKKTENNDMDESQKHWAK